MSGGIKRKRLMSWLSLLTGLIVTIIIVFVLVMHTDFFARSAAGMFSRYFFHGTDFTLRIDRLSGNPLKDITVSGLSVRYRGGDFSFDVLRVDRVHLRYSLLSFIRKDFRIEEIEVVHPHLWIKPDSSGAFIFPSTGGRAGGAFPRLEVSRFVVRDGQVIVQGPRRADALRSIDVRGSLHVDGWEVFLEIEDGAGEDLAREVTVRGISGGVRLVRLEGRGRNGRMENRIFLDRLSVQLDESNLTASGIVVPDSMSYHVKMHADPINIEEIMKLMRIESSHYGELQGEFVARGIPDSVRIMGVFNGIFSGYAVEYAHDSSAVGYPTGDESWAYSTASSQGMHSTISTSICESINRGSRFPPVPDVSTALLSRDPAGTRSRVRRRYISISRSVK